MIKGYREITPEVFFKNIVPHVQLGIDSIMKSLNTAVSENRDYLMIFRDYELRIKHDEIKRYLAETGGRVEAGVAAETIDSFLPPEVVPPVVTPREEAEAKPPKPSREFPEFKPGKKAPAGGPDV